MLLKKGGPHGQLTEDKVVKGINDGVNIQVIGSSKAKQHVSIAHPFI